MNQLTPEQYREQLARRVRLLERLIAIKAPSACIAFQRRLIEDTKLASGEYKAISKDKDSEGGSLVLT